MQNNNLYFTIFGWFPVIQFLTISQLCKIMIEINWKWKVSVNLGFREEEKLDLCEMGFRQKESRLFPSGNGWNKGISRKKDPKNLTSSSLHSTSSTFKNSIFLIFTGNLSILNLQIRWPTRNVSFRKFFFQDNPVLKCMNFVGKRATQLISQVHF